MKESLRNAYRKFSWDFADYLMYRGQLRGTAKARQKRVFTKGARQTAKVSLRNEIGY